MHSWLEMRQKLYILVVSVVFVSLFRFTFVSNSCRHAEPQENEEHHFGHHNPNGYVVTTAYVTDQS